jgi:hypothetical protein
MVSLVWIGEPGPLFSSHAGANLFYECSGLGRIGHDGVILLRSNADRAALLNLNSRVLKGRNLSGIKPMTAANRNRKRIVSLSSLV